MKQEEQQSPNDSKVVDSTLNASSQNPVGQGNPEDSLNLSSPKTKLALKLLGYAAEDFKKQTREQIKEKQREKLARVPKEKVNEYIELILKDQEELRQYKLQELQEVKKKIEEDQQEGARGSKQQSLISARSSHSQMSKEEFIQREHSKLEKQEEKQKKQIEFLFKSQLQANELRKKDEMKQEKIRLLEEHKLMEQRMRQLEAEEERATWEAKSIELEKAKLKQQEKQIEKYEEKQENLKLKLEQKERESQEKRAKNLIERQAMEASIAQNIQNQLRQLEIMQKDYEQKAINTVQRQKQVAEKRQQENEERRAISEKKRKLIEEQFQEQENQRLERGIALKQMLQQREYRWMESVQKEDQRRRMESEKKQAEIARVLQAQGLTLEQQRIKHASEEVALDQAVAKAREVRETNLQSIAQRQYLANLKAQKITAKARTLSAFSQLESLSVLNRLQEGNNRIQQSQEQQLKLALVRQQINDKNAVQKSAIYEQIHLIEAGKIQAEQVLGNSASRKPSNVSSPREDRLKDISTNNTGGHGENNLNKNQQDSVIEQHTLDKKPQELTNIQQQPQQQQQPGNVDPTTVTEQINSRSAGTTLEETSQSKLSKGKQNLPALAFKSNSTASNPLSYRNSSGHKNINIRQQQKQVIQPQNLKNSSVLKIIQNNESAPNLLSNQPPSRKGSLKPLPPPKLDNVSFIPQASQSSQGVKLLSSTTRSVSNGQDSQPKQLFSDPQKIRQRQLEYSAAQTCHNSNRNAGFPKQFFQSPQREVILTKKRAAQTSYKSNKFVKDTISDSYVSDIRVLQRIQIQDIQMLLSKSLLQKFQGESEKASLLDTLSNELSETYSKQENAQTKLHMVYSSWYSGMNEKERTRNSNSNRNKQENNNNSNLSNQENNKHDRPSNIRISVQLQE